jgi:A/G-specific adenine glycosylase
LPEPAIDGNVMRVVSRLFCIEADIAKASSRKVFDEAMRKIIDPQHPGEFNQAMMDLGSVDLYADITEMRKLSDPKILLSL